MVHLVPKQPTFGYLIGMDIGASTPNGSAEVAVFTDDGTLLGKPYKSQVSNTPIRSNEQFTRGLVDLVHQAQAQSEGIRANDQQLTGLGFFSPGLVTTDNTIKLIANLGGITNVNLNTVAEQLGLTHQVAANDMIGASIVVAKKLMETKKDDLQHLVIENNNQVKALEFMTGGGFGVSKIVFDKNDNAELTTRILPTEKGHGTTAPLADTAAEPHEAYAASVSGLLTRYAEALGWQATDPKTELLKETGLAQFVTQGAVTLDDREPQEKNAIDRLSQSKFHSLITRTQHNNSVTYRLKHVRLSEHRKAAKQAVVSSYVAVLARVALEEVLDPSFKYLTLTGPVAEGVDHYLRETTLLGLTDTLKKVIRESAPDEAAKAITEPLQILLMDNVQGNVMGVPALLDKRTIRSSENQFKLTV